MKIDLQWKPSNQKLYGRPCIEFSYPSGRLPTPTEYMLASRRGMIYPFNSTHAVVICKTAQSAKQIDKTLQVGLSQGSEHRVVIPNWEVQGAIKILGIPLTRPAQARAANRRSNG
jgi:hypothetical protein